MNNPLDSKPAKFLSSLAILFILGFQGIARSQDQAGTDRKATGKDETIACRFSALDMLVDIEVKDRNPMNVVVYSQGYSVQEPPLK